ncbi:MAG TPA: hypothetical protein VFK69_02355 [Candidatus Eisenbacteria bacterium]|nr:hypothetical protein [Candidatus Eisenbacteria bacterium]
MPLLALALLLSLAPAGPRAGPRALSAAPPRALFDDTHAETAGNADWVIDDNQPLPVPDQSTVLDLPNPRTQWTGANSSWGVDLVRRGYFVATLTGAYGITYGNAGNPYDLANFDVFIVCEPNTRFTPAESTAIVGYVADGGGLVAVSDHWLSDRNSDHFDSTQIWDLLDAHHAFFGAHFDTAGDANNNITQDSGNVDAAPDDSIIHGPNGVADSLAFHNGTTLTLDPVANPSVRGNVWMNGLAHGPTGVMAAQAVYGNGRIFMTCDSSPADDGSAEPGNSSIFDGWGEVSGRDSLLFQNATEWVTRRASPATGLPARPPVGLALSPGAPNPSRGGEVRCAFTLPAAGAVSLELFDPIGRRVWRWSARLSAGAHAVPWRAPAGARAGVYMLRLATPWGTRAQRLVRLP